MYITKKYNWSRRDFCFDTNCSGCGHETKNNSGYDDSYFLNTVMPTRVCESCGDSEISLYGATEIIPTKHNPSSVI